MLSETKIHDHGFVRLLSVYGSDNDIEDAARISYGTGTRKVSDTRKLSGCLKERQDYNMSEREWTEFNKQWK